METQGRERVGGPQSSETPEDVAILYSWANLQGAKYRDFSANRREYRAQMRRRAAEQIRLQELKAQAEAEASAVRADANAALAHAEADAAAARLAASRTIATALSGTPIDEEEAERVRKASLRAAAAQARKAAAERLEAARRAEAAAFAESNARREEREIAEAQASSIRQAAKYARTEAHRVQNGFTSEVPGEISDPYSPQILAEGEYFERPGTPLSDLESSRFKHQREYIEKATGTILPPSSGFPDEFDSNSDGGFKTNAERRRSESAGPREDLSGLFPDSPRHEATSPGDRGAKDKQHREGREPIDPKSSDPERDARLQDEFTARFEQSRSHAVPPHAPRHVDDRGRNSDHPSKPRPDTDPTFGAGQERYTSIPSIPYKEFRQAAANAQRPNAEVVRRIPEPTSPPAARPEADRMEHRGTRPDTRRPAGEPRIETYGDSRSIEIPTPRTAARDPLADREQPQDAAPSRRGGQPRPPSPDSFLSGLRDLAQGASGEHDVIRRPRPRMGSDTWSTSTVHASSHPEPAAPKKSSNGTPPDAWSSQVPAQPFTPAFGSVELSAPAWLYPKRQDHPERPANQRPDARPERRPEYPASSRQEYRAEYSGTHSASPAPQRPAPAQPSSVADTLQQSQEHVAARWYALRGIFDQPQAAKPAHRQRADDRDRTPNLLTVFSLAGGVGKTSLVATLGRGLASLGERVLLADTTSFGLLPFYYGANDLQPGTVRTFSPPAGSMDASIRMVGYELDHTECTRQAQDAVIDTLMRDSIGSTRVLLDLSGSVSWMIECIAHLKPTVLVPLAADMNSVISLQAIEASFNRIHDAEGKPLQPIYLLNQFDASLPLHLDVREVLRQRLGERLLPFAIRRANAVSEALAEGMTIVDYDPDSAVAQDYLSVAAWIRARSAPAIKGFRNLRWSER